MLDVDRESDRMREVSTAGFHSDRLIGSYTKGKAGNLILLFGGMHGNEISGVKAIRQVFERLNQHQPSFRGSVVGIAGNLGALASGQRYVQKDLNRLFDRSRLRALATGEVEHPIPEELEALELAQMVDRLLLNGSPTNLIFLDLHATSAPGGGFSVIRDSEGNREIASRMHLPLIFGLDLKLHATLMNYLYSLGFSGASFEGWQIGSREALEIHRAGIWTFLAGMGCIHPKDVPDYRHQVNRMIDAAENLPKAAHVFYRHSIQASDEFKMRPGFENFQQVEKNQILADDCNGPIIAPQSGMLLMPLYQAQGEDGFFLVEPVDY